MFQSKKLEVEFRVLLVALSPRSNELISAMGECLMIQGGGVSLVSNRRKTAALCVAILHLLGAKGAGVPAGGFI